MASSSDIESPPPPTSYAPLPAGDIPADPAPRRPGLIRPLRLLALAAVLLLCGLAALLTISTTGAEVETASIPAADRGVAAGVSAKSAAGAGRGRLGSAAEPNGWTNEMLAWQRPGFHFRPKDNWMNDPNGPMYYKGWYHFFYQYNPMAPVWGNIAWGHAVSQDLINWKHLPVALSPDQWYDHGGAWTGSATLLPNGQVVMLYTGGTNTSAQVQNLAVPVNHSDPFLTHWAKAEANPVITAPEHIDDQDFRDPTTAWYEPSDDTWRVAIGSKDSSHNGIALVYSTKDFISYTLLRGVLHRVNDVGMWECLDFYPVNASAAGANFGLDTSTGPGDLVKHVLKASTSDDGSDYYAVGTYDPAANKWAPDYPSLDVGVGLRYDWGKFYASKTFYDEGKQRRVLWGWIPETDSESNDLAKGWASLQGIPRTVSFDAKTGSHLLTWPVEEVESLRMEVQDFSGTTVGPGSTIPLQVGGAAEMLDIEAEFVIDSDDLSDSVVEADASYECSTSRGTADHGRLGPFGLLVLANDRLTEQTATYFYVSRASDGSLKTHFCQDELRSSKARDIVKRVVGHSVPVLEGETLSLRILVDHSIVESFAQGGRASATSRVYPMEAGGDAAHVFLFNNATSATVTAKTLKIWPMKSATTLN